MFLPHKSVYLINLPPGQLSGYVIRELFLFLSMLPGATAVEAAGTLHSALVLTCERICWTPESVSSATIAGAGTAPFAEWMIAAFGITLTVTIHFLPISSDTLIATLVCRAFVTDTNETAISVASSSGTSNCLSILGTGGETFTLTPQCGDPVTLTQFLFTGSPVTITGIVPNPAQTSIEVQLSSPSPTPISFTLSDPLGRSYEVRQTGNTLDISSLPSGVYFISDGVSRAKFVKE